MSTRTVTVRRPPPGIRLITRIRGQDWSINTYRGVVLFTTFIAYACYHASREPITIVKSVLGPELNNVTGLYPWPIGQVFIERENLGTEVDRFSKKGWEPFNGTDWAWKLGELDVAFLVSYLIGTFFSGWLGDSYDLRLILSIGMIGSGIFVSLFGMGYFRNVHMIWFYVGTQVASGLLQSTGWPSVVAVIGNWFGRENRGLIMGVWNAHTSLGNIVGSLLAASVLKYGWGWSFIAPGFLIILVGIMVSLFLAPYPEDIGFPSPNALVIDHKKEDNTEESLGSEGDIVEDEGNSLPRSEGDVVEDEGNSLTQNGSEGKRSVGFCKAIQIPGVIQFTLCLLFSKLVSYTFLYWLPFYLSQTAIGGKHVSVKKAGNLSTLFDVGGIAGGILAGYFSDKFSAPATTAAIFMGAAALVAMPLYRAFGNISMALNILLMMVAGLFVNAPCALITTAVSANLGTHRSLRGNARALSTVTSIIDGAGSIGAAFSPLLTGYLLTKGWNAVFFMLMVADSIAILPLLCLVGNECDERKGRHTTPLPSGDLPPARNVVPVLSVERKASGNEITESLLKDQR